MFILTVAAGSAASQPLLDRLHSAHLTGPQLMCPPEKMATASIAAQTRLKMPLKGKNIAANSTHDLPNNKKQQRTK